MYVVPAFSYWRVRKIVRVVESLIKGFFIKLSYIRIVKHENVVRLDVESTNGEICGTGQYLLRYIPALFDEYFIVRKALEVSGADVVRAGRLSQESKSAGLHSLGS